MPVVLWVLTALQVALQVALQAALQAALQGAVLQEAARAVDPAIART